MGFGMRRLGGGCRAGEMFCGLSLISRLDSNARSGLEVKLIQLGTSSAEPIMLDYRLISSTFAVGRDPRKSYQPPLAVIEWGLALRIATFSQHDSSLGLPREFSSHKLGGPAPRKTLPAFCKLFY
jgi:hypothetical protein